jgi:predicted amidohydrolase YtcJ
MADEIAKLALTNARIWTGEPSLPYAEELMIHGDTIIAIGTKEQIRPLIDAKTEVLDVTDNLVLPGFIDNHAHLMLGGLQLLSLDLREVRTAEEFIQTIAAKAANMPPGQWITGGGWEHDQWAQVRIPVKAWVDGFTPHIPVFLIRADLHMGFANSAALRLAGITGETADPPGGMIERDGRTYGHP